MTPTGDELGHFNFYAESRTRLLNRIDALERRIAKLEEFVTIVGNGNWDVEFLLKRARELMGKEPKP